MKNISTYFIILSFFYGLACNSQNKFTLSGAISEIESNESVIGVNLYIPELKLGTTSNEYGFFSITLPAGSYNMIISSMGYQTITDSIDLFKNITKNYRLVENIEPLNEIIITENIERLDIKKPQMSVNSLTSNTIKNIPVVLGEPDIIKAITLLPGVTNAGEGASGFNVRGGAVDQNLILLDEATIYNASHLFGFFSVFNPDAIKYLKLYKGGIPARYGGRVSSVLDMYQKDGNSKALHVNGGLGIVSSRLLIEGPLKKNKSAFLLGGRSSYAHLFLPLFDIDNEAYFYDLNTKLSFKIDHQNSMYVSGYFGRDVFSIADSFENIYGNAIINLRWNHLFSNKLFSNLSFIYSDYYYDLKLNFVEFKWNSGIQNFNIKYDFKYYLNNKVTLQFGLNSMYYLFNPGKIEPTTETSGISPFKLIDKYALENAVYIDSEYPLSKKLAVSFGLRLSTFMRFGQQALQIYENDQAVNYNEDLQIYEKATPIRVQNFKRSEVIKSFINMEPRLSLAYQLSSSASIKGSYNRMSQYLHLISNTSSPTPLDVWTPSGKYIRPQLLDQYALGYFKNFNDTDYSLEIEGFYKNVKNRIDYIDGADLIANNAIEQVILNGRAKAYGLELLLKKNEGRLTGWLAYTLSKSQQRTAGRSPNERGINNGHWYYTPHDKTHDISLTSSYQYSDKWKLHANFLFQTGRPTTYPNLQYVYNGVSVPNFGPRNANRLPAYSRLDLSTTYTPKPHKKTGWQSYWVFGIYNVYNRRNAASINFGNNETTGLNEATRLSIFGIVPSLSYNFKF